MTALEPVTRTPPREVLLLTGTVDYGAGGRAVVYWARGLREHNVRMHVAYPGGGELSQILQSESIPSVEVDLSWPRRLWPFPFLRSARKLARYVRNNGVELIHCNGAFDFILGRSAAKSAKVPTLCHIRLPRDSQFYEWLLGRNPVPRRLICVSESLAEQQRLQVDSSGYDARNVIPLYNPLDAEEFQPDGRREAFRSRHGLPVDAFCIGVVGTVKPWKQTHCLVDVIAEMRARGRDTCGVIVGPVSDQEYQRQVQKLTDDNEVQDHIYWTGPVQDVPEAYNALDLTASFSKGETFGYSAAESLACQCPVVFFSIPAFLEVVRQGGMAVEMGDIGGFVTACLQLMGDADLRDRLGRQGRDHVKNSFSIASSTGRLFEIYSSVLQESSGRSGADRPGQKGSKSL
ncbi:MAG: glycosyltransferase family 4 protein [Phycisphaerae bacterium]